MEREAQGFLERCDDWLSSHEAAAGADGAPLRLGAGVYLIQERLTGEQT
jgi:hypothetical protein